MSKKALVLGASGMAGQAFMKKLKESGFTTQGLSRKGPDIYDDLLINASQIHKYLNEYSPDLIINCAAIVSIEYCERNPDEAEKLNSHIPKVLASAMDNSGAKLIQISTDHYYTGDKDKKHSESDPITLANKYAETKYKGEQNALQYERTTVIRTNITGYRGYPNKPTFIEWLLDCLRSKKSLILFDDFYTSTIDVNSFCDLCLDPGVMKTSGLLNIASSCPITKKDFAYKLAEKLNIQLDWALDASVSSLSLPRANSLGLDCTKAEGIINKSMPSPDQVITNLAKIKAKL